MSIGQIYDEQDGKFSRYDDGVFICSGTIHLWSLVSRVSSSLSLDAAASCILIGTACNDAPIIDIL